MVKTTKNKTDVSSLIQKEMIGLIIAGISIAIIVMSFLFTIQPKYNELEDIKKQIQITQALIEKKSGELASLQSNEGLVLGDNDNKKAKEQKITIPEKLDIPALMRIFDFIAGKGSGVSLKSYKITSLVPLDEFNGISELGATINIELSKDKLKSLLERFEYSETQLFKIEDISATTSEDLNMQATLKIKTYYISPNTDNDLGQAASITK